MEIKASRGTLIVMATETEPALSRLQAFLDSSTSPFHAVNNAKEILLQHGFVEVYEIDDWEQGNQRNFTIRDGSLIAWAIPSQSTPENGFRIVGAHTDSPNLRIKAIQTLQESAFSQLSIEVYGSPLLNSWLDRDLGISGRVVLQSEPSKHVLFSTDDPICRIPQLAIHLDREVNSSGLKLNPQSHLTPIWADAQQNPTTFKQWLASELSINVDEIAAWDLMLHDCQKSDYLGANNEWLASARIDNLVSCYAAVASLCEIVPEDLERVPVVCLFDHEEVGSVSAGGASGDFLVGILNRLMSGISGESKAKAYAHSLCLSVDGAHGSHPNYPERHDPEHVVTLNGGIVIKKNANQRYATDAIGEAMAKSLCEQINIPHQSFSNRNDLSCGSTIGPTTAARLGVRTIDIGAPQLSMHSIREICGVDDQGYLRSFTETFLRSDHTTFE